MAGKNYDLTILIFLKDFIIQYSGGETNSEVVDAADPKST
jgi:hypothetical protein